MLNTEYFSAYHGNPDEGLAAAKKKRNQFLDLIGEDIEEISTENIQATSSGNTWFIIITLSYYLKKK